MLFDFCIAFPKNAVGIALDLRRAFGAFKPFFGPNAIVGILFNADKASSQFLAVTEVVPEPRNGSKTRSPGLELAKIKACKQFFRFWVGGPYFPAWTSRGSRCRPKSWRGRCCGTCRFRLLPSRGDSRRSGTEQSLFANFDRFEIKGILIAQSGKPNVFHAVFPVMHGAAAFSRCQVMRLRI